MNFALFYVRKTDFHAKKQQGMKELRQSYCLESFDLPHCFMREQNRNIEHGPAHNTSQNQQGCVMLLNSNLATPQWVQVNCSLKLLSHNVCVLDKKSDERPSLQQVVGMEYCFPSSVLVDGNCLVFLSLQLEIGENSSEGFSGSKHHIEHWLSGNTSDIFYTFLKTLFEASSLSSLSFVFKSDSARKAIHFHKTWLKIQESESDVLNHPDTTLIGLNYPSDETAVGSLTQRCSNGEYMSSAFVCGERPLCLTEPMIQDKKWHSSKNCSGTSTSSSHRCSPLFYASKHNRCKSFILHAKTNSFGQGQHFTVKCDGFGMQDTYKLSEVCIYKVNLSVISPCQQGSHLQDCKAFNCSLHFKCPGHYCVPWTYICDGMWDCPEGYDEQDHLNCSRERTCSNMYRCKDTSLCSHINDICDGFANCPFGDDEMQCGLMHMICPKGCVCLNFALQCEHTILHTFHNWKYVSYYITFSKVSMISLVRHFMKHKVFFVCLPNNALKYILPKSFTGDYLYLVDYSSNDVTEVDTYSFSDMGKISFIGLKNNSIEKLYTFAITNISSVFSLDLSGNNISEITRNCINAKYIASLVLNNNPIMFLEKDTIVALSIYIITTDHCPVCCFQLAEKCRTKKHCLSCDDLLPSAHSKTLFLVVSIVVFSLNCFSIALNLWKSSKKAKSFPGVGRQNNNSCYNIIVCANHGTDILCAMYLYFIWFLDRNCNQLRPIFEHSWKKNGWCVFALTSITLCVISTPVLSLFLSFSRYFVVKYPFDSNFKRKSFVVKFLFSILGIAGIFTLVIVTMLFMACSTSMDLCLPFVSSSAACFPFHLGITFLITLLQVSAIVITTSLHFAMYVSLKKTKSDINQGRQVGQAVVVQLVLLGLSSTVSWTSNIVFLFFPLFLSRELLSWTTGLLLPFNPMMNPSIVIVSLLKQ